MRIINFIPLHDEEQFFPSAERAIAHGSSDERVYRARADLVNVRGASVVDSWGDWESTTFLLSNGKTLSFRVVGNVVDWQVSSTGEPRNHREESSAEPVLLRSRHGEAVFDREKTHVECRGRRIAGLSPSHASVQLLLSDVPIAFMPCLREDTGETFLFWFSMNEPPE